MIVRSEVDCPACGLVYTAEYEYGTVWLECPNAACGAWNRVEEIIWRYTLPAVVFRRELIVGLWADSTTSVWYSYADEARPLGALVA